VVPFDKHDIEIKKSDKNDLLLNITNRNFDKNLVSAILDKDKKAIDYGKIVIESINHGTGFNPDILFEQIVNNFSLAKKIYGEALIRLITGYEPKYIEKNIKIPEFRKEIKKNIVDKIQKLKEDDIINEDGNVSDKGIELASLISAVEELENLGMKGFYGTKTQKMESFDGEKDLYRDYKKGINYRDIAVKRSVKMALRRGHNEIFVEDLRAFTKKRKGKCYIIYCIDCSGSMKGEKIENAKRAGIALAYKAIYENDEVGLIVFGEKIRKTIAPTKDFVLLLKEITKLTAAKETNIVMALKKAVELFPEENAIKHIILITDALPTAGPNPEKETIKSAANIRDKGITISVVGISLDKNGRELAKKIVDVGKGKLYIARNIENIDRIVLEDYYQIA